MKTTICLFEDNGFRNLLPLAYLKPVYDLRCGIFSLREKIVNSFPKYEVTLHCRNYLSKTLAERNPGKQINIFQGKTILFINGRLLIDEKIKKEILKLSNDIMLLRDDELIAVKISEDRLRDIQFDEEGILLHQKLEMPHIETSAKLIKYPWDLIKFNGAEICNDFDFVRGTLKAKNNFARFKSVEFINKKKIILEKGIKIDPFCFLDASGGPIYLGQNAYLQSHSYIQGPAYIGAGSLVKAHTSIYHDTSIGKVCKAGGEIEASILDSYSNKQHDGFLGHSYLSSWVNIAAGTITSDLKNNYGNIDVLINNKPVKSNLQLVGLFMGDHSKTSINMSFNTGTVVGIACNIFGMGFPKKYLPSFTWGGVESSAVHDMSKVIETAKIVMKRRNVELTNSETELLEKVFYLTSEERNTIK